MVLVLRSMGENRSMTMTMATALTMTLLVVVMVVVRTVMIMITLNPHLDKELDGKVCEADHAHGTGHRHHLRDL